jgi:hypothetical protein
VLFALSPRVLSRGLWQIFPQGGEGLLNRLWPTGKNVLLLLNGEESFVGCLQEGHSSGVSSRLFLLSIPDLLSSGLFPWPSLFLRSAADLRSRPDLRSLPDRRSGM